MCIVLLTTAHPDYALILIDNRDEYILRPTSRPHWWTHPISGRSILSSRDLHRKERGTWLGITKDGLLAVLTNYRESDSGNVQGVRSRGGMVTAWLGGLPGTGSGSVMDGVDSLVRDGGVKGVGGFSMVCGKLRRKSAGIAIVSNRAAAANKVPLVGQQRGEVWGLSNAVFNPSDEWPKVASGKRLLRNLMESAASKPQSQDALIKDLFDILDTDTLPPREPDTTFASYIDKLRFSIFVPPIGDEAHQLAMLDAMARGRDGESAAADSEQLRAAERPDPTAGGTTAFDTGAYGTQRQTVLLVDWDGNVTFVERALWDGHGLGIAKGEGDLTIRFKIDCWDE